MRLLERQSERLERLETLTGASSPHPAPCPVAPPKLPAESIEEVEAAAEALKDEASPAGPLGVSSFREAATGVMKAIMTPTVQRLYSLHGKKGKRGFLTTRLCKVVTGLPAYLSKKQPAPRYLPHRQPVKRRRESSEDSSGENAAQRIRVDVSDELDAVNDDQDAAQSSTVEDRGAGPLAAADLESDLAEMEGDHTSCSPTAGALPRQLEEAVCRATDEYVRQGQCADARALADRKFHHKMLEQNRCRHEAQMASQERLENQLCRLTEEVGRLRHVQQQRLDQKRRANECTQRLLQQLLEALAGGAALVTRPP
ncbi:hypothetical protein HPB52_005491 [Rhipicephalus sanguineus]|uniref:Uncharacterized protein n=1 Tax=Rhipicephalus sanguineus TaxID=34632 RepID=A0A9D4SXQ5_RHISA|nr:hypothetical protein HPB52_005491 [Rhipicephalus sanguineus]